MSVANSKRLNKLRSVQRIGDKPHFAIEDRGLIYDATARPPESKATCCSSLLPLRDGNWLAGFQIGPEKHSSAAHIRLFRSLDCGVRWTPLEFEFNPIWNGVAGSLTLGELVETKANELMIVATWFDRSQPERPLLNPETEGLLDSKLLKSFSYDKGNTWTDWQEIDIPNLAGCAISGPILCWDDGRIALSFESFKGYDDPRTVNQASWIFPTVDNGRTFSKPLQLAASPTGEICYWDQRLSTGLKNGDFVGLYWTHDRRQKKDLPVHACRGTLCDSQVTDFELWETSLQGQISAPLVLEDGRWLAAVVDRRKPATIRVWCSRDYGKTWPREDSLVIHQHEELAPVSQGTENVDFKKYWEDFGKWSFGHPALRHLGNHEFLLAFYAGTPGCINGHWVRFSVQ